MEKSNAISYFARSNFRNQNTLFGIKQADRLLHTYILGKTGTGKSTLLKTLILQDMEAGRGLCLLDPHGDLVTEVLKCVPATRKQDVIYFDITNPTLTLKYNPFRKVSLEKRSLVASGILEVFEKLWASAWGVKLEHILRHAILTLLDQPQATIADIPKLLLDKAFRTQSMQHIKNDSVRSFWQKEFNEYTKYDLMPVMNKLGGLLAHHAIKRVLVTNSEEISLRKAMDEKKIMLVNLSKGHIGGDVAEILGGLFLTSLGMAAYSRADISEHNRSPFMVFCDECHLFTTKSLAGMCAELRKFKVGLVLAIQYMQQLQPDIKQALFGNVGTIISFRTGIEDAQYLAKEMYPIFGVEDFINLANYNIYLKLMIDGKPSKPFSATLL